MTQLTQAPPAAEGGTPEPSLIQRLLRVEHLPYAFALLAVGYYLFREYNIVGAFGFTLDDAWIHAVFARNLAHGHGFSFNPGEPINGSTSMLWTLLLTFPLIVTERVVFVGKLLGIMLHLTSVWLTGRILRLLVAPGIAIAGMCWVALTPRLLWGTLSGMEVTLCAALALAALWRYLAARAQERAPGWEAGLLAAACVWVRPECLLLLILLEVQALFPLRRIEPRRLLPRWAVALAVLLAFIGVNWMIAGKPLPQTFYAKAAQSGLLNALRAGDSAEAVKALTAYPLDALQTLALRIAFFDNPLFPALALLGALAIFVRRQRRRAALILPVIVLLVPVLIGVLIGQTRFAQYQRYAFYLSPYIVLLAAVGVDEALAWPKHERWARRRWFAWGAALLSLIPAVWWAERVFDSARDRSLGVAYNQEVSRIAAWVALAVVVLAAIFALIPFIERLGRPVWQRAVAGAIIAVPLLVGTWYGASIYALHVKNIHEMQVQLGQMLHERTEESDVLAVNDIGAIAWFSERRVLDMKGLVTPEILPWRFSDEYRTRTEGIWAYIEQEQPEYMVIFPNWYGPLYRRRDIVRHMQAVHQVTIEDNITCGGPTMVVYRLRWDR